MNRAILMGRLTADPELRQTPSGLPVAQFTVAINRPVKQGAEPQADFIKCVAWKQTAEFITRYFQKGEMIAVEGRIQVRTYDDRNGQRQYITEVVVDHAHFTGEKREQAQQGWNAYQQPQNGGGYQQPQAQAQQGWGGYQQQPAQQPRQQPAQKPQQQPLSVANLDDFEEILSDGQFPF